MSGPHLVVVRLDALGDTLLSTPALAALRERHPGARLTVLTSPAGTPVLRPLAQIVEVSGRLPDLRDWKPDAVLVFTEKRAGLLAAARSRAPLRVGFDPGWTQPLKHLAVRHSLTHRVDFPNDPRQDPGLHEVERYCRLVEQLGGPPVEPGPLLLEVPPSLRRQERAWLAENFPRAPVAIQLTPKWRVQDALLTDLLRRHPGPVLALYGPAERSWAEPLVARAGVISAYRPDLLHYAALLAGCRQLISVDTGAVHVAAALGVPVVDVFPTRHQAHCVRRWSPWKVEHRVVLQGEALLERILLASSELEPSPEAPPKTF